MKILNFGSLNYDNVYSVDHILVPGETLSAGKMETFCGGKGLNQSIALKMAGADVFHAGLVGEDGSLLLDLLKQNGVDVSNVKTVPGKSGHTVIQVDSHGQNGILLFGGSNRRLTREWISKVFSGFSAGDMLLLQNEVNGIDYIIDLAYRKGMRIAFNPSPFDDAVKQCDLHKISVLLLNEIEGYQIAGVKNPDGILGFFKENYPNAAIVLTLGKDGVVYQDQKQRLSHGIYPVKVVDTTAAGDTFTGFFLACVMKNKPVQEALEIASKASSIAVTRKGAAPSIPALDEVQNFCFPEESR